MTHIGEKQWSKTSQHGLSVKEKKPKHTHTHTRAHTLKNKTENKNPIFFNSILHLQPTQIQNYFTMLPFLIQKMPILGVYIYIYIFFFFFSGLLLTYLLTYLLYLFIYLYLAVLGLRFCARAFSSCGKWGPLFIAVRGPLTAVASLVAEHRLQTRRLSSRGSRA